VRLAGRLRQVGRVVPICNLQLCGLDATASETERIPGADPRYDEGTRGERAVEEDERDEPPQHRHPRWGDGPACGSRVSFRRGERADSPTGRSRWRRGNGVVAGLYEVAHCHIFDMRWRSRLGAPVSRGRVRNFREPGVSGPSVLPARSSNRPFSDHQSVHWIVPRSFAACPFLLQSPASRRLSTAPSLDCSG
jgi:hypothetical protein